MRTESSAAGPKQRGDLPVVVEFDTEQGRAEARRLHAGMVDARHNGKFLLVRPKSGCRECYGVGRLESTVTRIVGRRRVPQRMSSICDCVRKVAKRFYAGPSEDPVHAVVTTTGSRREKQREALVELISKRRAELESFRAKSALRCESQAADVDHIRDEAEQARARERELTDSISGVMDGIKMRQEAVAGARRGIEALRAEISAIGLEIAQAESWIADQEASVASTVDAADGEGSRAAELELQADRIVTQAQAAHESRMRSGRPETLRRQIAKYEDRLSRLRFSEGGVQ